jgi:hypothetical protein
MSTHDTRQVMSEKKLRSTMSQDDINISTASTYVVTYVRWDIFLPLHLPHASERGPLKCT